MISEKDINQVLYNAVKDIYLYQIKKDTPKLTGKTANAWKIKLKDGYPVIYNEKFGDIVRYLEEGTGLYGPYKHKYENKGGIEIKPKTAKFLKFEIDGKTIFTKKVINPGIKARRFIQKILDNKWLKERLDNAIQAEFAFLLSQMGVKQK